MTNTLYNLFFNRGPILIISLLNIILISTVLSQTNCTKKLDEAQKKYNIGLFRETIDILKPCLPGGFSEEQIEIEGHRLIALAYLGLDYPDSAKIHIQEIINLDSFYEVNRENNPKLFIDLIDEEKPSWYEKWYTIVIGSAIITGTIMYMLLKEEIPESKPLPGPPALP